MKGDFTRFTFDRSKHYRGVVMQQGRVTLDADWNENLGIQAHQLQTLARDVIGECGVPVHVDAFKVTAPAIDLNMQSLDFDISAGPAGKGRMYVSGLLTEIEQDTTYLTQPDWLSAPINTTLPGLGPVLPALSDGETRLDRVYIDVWRRTISAVEDPHLREVALGGPDTAERIKLVWQVKVDTGVDPKTTCNTSLGLPVIGGGLLRVVVNPQPVPPDPCEPTAQGGYTGGDNRFYRIEIHKGGPLNTATFKWSRDNGSVLASIQQFKSATEVVVRSLGKDDYLKFKTGDWVEITDDGIDLSGLPGTLAQITVDEASRTLTLSNALPDAVWRASDRHPKVRRWDGGDAQVMTGGVQDIEAGIQIQFTATADDFRSGDCWTFAARVIDGSLDPSLEQPTPPMGVLHAYCGLALITWTRNGNKVTAVVQDCRLLFPPLTEIPAGQGCCTVSVGDGVSTHGDFTDLQAAINSLGKGGQVCILGGDYPLAAPIKVNIDGLTISGCGGQTKIHAAAGQAAFLVSGVNLFELEGLSIDGQCPDGLVQIGGSRTVEVADCEIINLSPNKDTSLDITRVNPRTSRKAPSATPAGPTSFNDFRFTANLPANSPLVPAGPGLVVTDSLMVRVINNQIIGLPALSLQAQFLQARSNDLSGGGAWLREGSGQAVLKQNTIVSGQGSGVLLGGLGANEKPSEKFSGVQNVQVIGNTISQMDNGITTLAMSLEQLKLVGDVSDLSISDNRITGCVHGSSNQAFTETVASGGIVLRNVTQLRIHHNMIAQNGLAGGTAACGIFVFLCEDLEVSDNTVVDNGESISDASQLQCVDFSSRSTGAGANPRLESGATFSVYGADGSLAGASTIRKSGSLTGLDVQYKTAVSLAAPTTSVQLTLASTAGAGRIEALNEDGSSAGTFTTQQGSQAQTISISGTSINLINVIAPKNEMLLLKICFGAGETAFQAGIAALDVIGGWSGAPGQNSPYTAPVGKSIGRPAARIHDNEVICPRGQALIAIGLGSMSINDNTLISYGFRNQPDLTTLLGVPGGQFNSLLASSGSVLVYNLGRAADGSGYFGLSNSFSHYNVSTAGAVIGQSYPDGRIQFHDNQVSLFDQGESSQTLERSSICLMTLDDVSIEGNQVLTETPNEILVISTLSFGMTARATGNRFSEIPQHAAASYLGVGASAITVNNQATQCILTLAANKIDGPNLSIFCP